MTLILALGIIAAAVYAVLRQVDVRLALLLAALALGVLTGASLGGELLNPGAPELRTISEVMKRTVNPDFTSDECVERVVPLLFLQLGVATTVFWVISARAEATSRRDHVQETTEDQATVETPPFRVNYLKAIVPLVP